MVYFLLTSLKFLRSVLAKWRTIQSNHLKWLQYIIRKEGVLLLHELFLYFTEKSDHRAKKFGHLREIIGLVKRQKRCEIFWKPHQNNCHQLILQTIENLAQKKSILILGTGTLFEIPIDEIVNKFEKIVLVDIVHLKSVRKRLKHFSHVEFIEHDITELENDLLRDKKIINKIPQRFLQDQFDLVISANVLSQLTIHLKIFSAKHMKQYTENELAQFFFQVNEDHYRYLKSFLSPVLLITDVETHAVDHKKNISEIEKSFPGFSLPEATSSWTWNLAPAPEFNPQVSLQMKMVGIILNGQFCNER